MKTYVNNCFRIVICALVTLFLLDFSVLAYPPDPDNAALLYYQAFLLYEKTDDTMGDMISDLAAGKIEPNPQILKHIENCSAAIYLVVTASELDKCDWGLRYSEGLDLQMPYLSQIRNIVKLILADARKSLAEGDYNFAIERCLTARRIALHVAEGPTLINFLVGVTVETLADECIEDILSSQQVDLETLKYLKAQLSELDNKRKPIKYFLVTEQEVMGMYFQPQRVKELLPFIDNQSLITIKDEAQADIRKAVLAADEQFCRRNLAYFNECWEAIYSAVELPYEQAYKKLAEINDSIKQKSEENPDTILTMVLAPAIQRIYNHDIKIRTFSNALRTALEIYIIKTQTGHLPEELPAGMPKDLFSGEDFEYEKKADGFVLRCKKPDLMKDETYVYEFKVK
ncbi:MAG: hypothetical protein JW804_04345 [Sedimentisphaerales bacterium]|nr:hypothetical protein [Sedimentisphaerales bacterium]